MDRDAANPPPPAPAPDADLSGTYRLVILVEIVVIAALFWLGRWFA